MVELVRQSWLLGEALMRAFQERELQWQLHSRGQKRASENPGPESEKRLRTASEFEGSPICKRFNDNRGCAGGSCGKVLRCDALKPDGRVCGSKQHNRTECPRLQR
jgi:hypothetical protein